MPQKPTQEQIFYAEFGKSMYRITGAEQSDAIMDMLSVSPSANNASSVQFGAEMIGSGFDSSTTIAASGAYQAGKSTFDNTAVGFIIGIDPTDGKAKFYIGDTVNYFNWTGSAGVLAGNFSVKSLDIPDTTTVASFHVDTTGRHWSGANASNYATAPFRVDAAGNLTASSVTITGGSVAGTSISSVGSSTDLSLMIFTQNMAFTSASATQVNWTSGTINMSNGGTYAISSGNTGAMAALTYIYLDTALSSTVLQTTTTYSTAIGANKILLAVAQNNSVGASVIPYGGGQPVIDGTAQIAALSITAASIAAATITAGKMSVTQLSAITANLGSITSGSISVVNGGNTIGLTPSGTNAIFSGPTGAPNFYVTPSGYATAIGLTSLNMKSFTNFETVGRFNTNNVAGSGAATFSNQGGAIAPGTTATSYIQMLWYVTNNQLFTQNATFTCGVQIGTGASSGDGRAYIGIGYPTISGSGMTYTGRNYAGFIFQKVSGTTSMFAQQCDGSGAATGSATLTTLVTGDAVELFVKMRAGAIDYYYRKNGGALSAVTTLTTNMPSGSETYCAFETTNSGSTNDFQFIMQNAGYEH